MTVFMSVTRIFSLMLAQMGRRGLERQCGVLTSMPQSTIWAPVVMCARITVSESFGAKDHLHMLEIEWNELAGALHRSIRHPVPPCVFGMFRQVRTEIKRIDPHANNVAKGAG